MPSGAHQVPTLATTSPPIMIMSGGTTSFAKDVSAWRQFVRAHARVAR
jgi:hypothetical protein